MKNDVILTALVNFLIPIILLLAFFSLVDYIHNGFFSIINSIILLAIAFMIYTAKLGDSNSNISLSVQMICQIFILIAAIYLIFILFILVLPKMNFIF